MKWQKSENNRQLVWIAVLCLALVGVDCASAMTRGSYRLASGDGVFGQAFYVESRHEDTLLDIGRRNGVGYDEMRSANPGVDVWIPGAGNNILVPTQYVVPNAPRRGLVLNLAEKRLYYFPSSGSVTTHAISIGREGWNTPLGHFSIVSKARNPTWRPPASIRAEHATQGDILPAVVLPGPDNPLGKYAMRLSARGYLIHGTNKPWGLGMRISHGCIRMYPEDIERLFPKIPVGASVKIVDQPFKVGWLGNNLYLEVHAEGKKRAKVRAVIPASITKAWGVRVDWEEVRQAIKENTGLPHLVGDRQKRPMRRLYLDKIF